MGNAGPDIPMPPRNPLRDATGEAFHLLALLQAARDSKPGQEDQAWESLALAGLTARKLATLIDNERQRLAGSLPPADAGP